MLGKGVVLAALALVIFAAVSDGAKARCVVKGRTMTRYGGSQRKTQQIPLPCKYKAVDQPCDKYRVQITPGQMSIPPWYITDSLRIVIKNESDLTQTLWQGRTSNDIAGMYLYHKKHKNGTDAISPSVAVQEVQALKGGLQIKIARRDENSIMIKDVESKFVISFQPYDPSKNLRSAQWEFTCQLTKEQKKHRSRMYTQQICDDREGMGITNRTAELKFNMKHGGDIKALYYDTFVNNPDITQTDDRCIETSRLLTDECTEEKRVEAIDKCWQILGSKGHTRCAAKHTCHVMDVFKDCVQFVCQDDKEACKRVGQAINLCREFKDLSKAVEDRNCFPQFLYRFDPEPETQDVWGDSDTDFNNGGVVVQTDAQVDAQVDEDVIPA